MGLPTPPPIKVVVIKEVETYFPSDPIPFSSKTQLLPLKIETSQSKLPLSPKIQATFVPIKNPYPPCSPTVHNPMEGANIPRNRMDATMAARYAPLILPQHVNSLPIGDYLKYMPKFTGEEDITAEEHLSAIYRFVDIQLIENEDV